MFIFLLTMSICTTQQRQSIKNFGTEADDTNEVINNKMDKLINKTQKVLSDIIKTE